MVSLVPEICMNNFTIIFFLATNLNKNPSSQRKIMGLSVKKCENWKKMAKNSEKIEFVGQFLAKENGFRPTAPQWITANLRTNSNILGGLWAKSQTLWPQKWFFFTFESFFRYVVTPSYNFSLAGWIFTEIFVG